MASKNQELMDAEYLAIQLRISPILQDGAGEKPDIIWNLDGINIGLEVTSGASSDFHRLMDLSEKGRTPNIMNIGNLSDGMVRQSNKELIDMAKSNNYVNIRENNFLWKDKIISKIQRKTLNLNRGNYRIFDQNWLLIFDREVDLSYKINKYCDTFNTEYIFNLEQLNFDKIFIIGFPYILTFYQGVWMREVFRNDCLANEPLMLNKL